MNYRYAPNLIEAVEVTRALLAAPYDYEWPEGWPASDVIAKSYSSCIVVKDGSNSGSSAFIGDFIVRTGYYTFKVMNERDFNYLFRPDSVDF